MQVSLNAVMLHEAGHLLGVPHSSSHGQSSAMYSQYDTKNADNFLDTFERANIQRLYGNMSRYLQLSCND